MYSNEFKQFQKLPNARNVNSIKLITKSVEQLTHWCTWKISMSSISTYWSRGF